VKTFSGPSLERVLEYIAKRDEGVPPVVARQNLFYHLRAWASSRFRLPREQDYPILRDIELVEEGGRIVAVRVLNPPVSRELEHV
jgi:hypothetical protein